MSHIIKLPPFPWWRHQMEFFRVTGPFGGNPAVTGGFPHKDQWRGALLYFIICAWTNGGANNREKMIWDDITLIMTSP